MSLIIVTVRFTNADETSAQRVETEQEKDCQQLKQASDSRYVSRIRAMIKVSTSDTAALLQDELIQAADRERRLQMQVDKLKDDIGQLQTQLEQLSSVQSEFEEYKQRSAPLWEEQEMKERDSKFNMFSYIIEAVHTSFLYTEVEESTA